MRITAAAAGHDLAARADALVPEKPVHITDSVHDAQLAAGTLMQGLPVALKTGMNHIEYVDTLMATMAMIIQQQGQTADMKTIQGLQNMAQNISQHIQLVAQDPQEKQRVKVWGDQLGKMMNLVKAMAQRLMEQMKKQQQQAGQNGDPAAAAKVQATIIQAQTKAKLTSDSHAQRTAQRQIQFEQQQLQKKQDHDLQMQIKAAEAGLDLVHDRLKMLNGEHSNRKSEE